MKGLRLLRTLMAAFALLGPFASPCGAKPFSLGNLLVTFRDTLYEIDRTGSILQEIPVPPNEGSAFEVARDLIVDPRGFVHVFNGTRTPVLSTYDPAHETWSSTSIDGWNLSPNIFYGGLAIDGSTVFASDMSPLYPMEDPGGYVAFDVSSSPAAFRPSLPFLRLDLVDLALAPGHTFCGLRFSSTLYCFSTEDFTSTGAIRLGSGIQTVAITDDGTILGPATASGGRILRFASDGSLEFESAGFMTGLGDIDAWPDGTVTLGSRSGAVVLTDASLTSFEVLQPFGPSPVSPATTFVAMVTAEASIPAPKPIPGAAFRGLAVLAGFLAFAGAFALRGHR